jgi:ubiquinone/menaquinone biosynthesis C-methylase UbiE
VADLLSIRAGTVRALALAAPGAERTCFEESSFDVVGTPHADVIVGTPGPDRVHTGRGDDVLVGRRRRGQRLRLRAALNDRHLTHVSLWDRLGARVYDPFLWLGERRGMARRRRDLLAHAEGRVLELGAGTGINLRHYPGSVEALVLTEPVEPMARALQRRLQRLGRLAEVRRASAEALPFGDDSFDTVVSTLVLCTVQDQARALSEIARVLAPGGRLLFIEHLRSQTERWGRWQDRLERPWAAFACGCRCNRRTLERLARSPLTIEQLTFASWHGMPPLVRPLAIGTAIA